MGRVSAIGIAPDGRIRVTIAVKKATDVPGGTLAKMAATDLLGTKAIALILGDGKDLIAPGTELPSAVEGSIIDALSAEITPLLLDLRHVVGTFDTLVTGVNGVLDPAAKANLQASIANLNQTTENFAALSTRLNAEGGQISGIIRNTNAITENLAANNTRIDRIILNAETTTQQLTDAHIDQTIAQFKSAALELQDIMGKVNSSQGSLGLLVNDKGLYNSLNTSLGTLNSLMADVEAHPARYINVSIFGHRKP